MLVPNQNRENPTAYFPLWPDRHPPVALFAIAPLDRRPSDAVHHRLTVRIPCMLPPGIVERGEIDLLRMRRKMGAHGIRQVVGRDVWYQAFTALSPPSGRRPAGGQKDHKPSRYHPACIDVSSSP